MKLGHAKPDDHSRKAHDRADREVELAADHEERHGGGEDAEFGRYLQHVDDAARGEEARIPGERREGEDDKQRAGERPELRPTQQPRQPRSRPQAFVLNGDCQEFPRAREQDRPAADPSSRRTTEFPAC